MQISLTGTVVGHMVLAKEHSESDFVLRLVVNPAYGDEESFG